MARMQFGFNVPTAIATAATVGAAYVGYRWVQGKPIFRTAGADDEGGALVAVKSQPADPTDPAAVAYGNALRALVKLKAAQGLGKAETGDFFVIQFPQKREQVVRRIAEQTAVKAGAKYMVVPAGSGVSRVHFFRG